MAVGLLILAGGTLYFFKISILYLGNRDHSKSCWIRVSASERFSIVYIHSIYQEPVVEEFQIDQGTIVLKGVRALHPGILEYYGFEDMKEFHPMDRRLGSTFFRVGMGEEQRLWIRNKKISFREVGEKGDQLRLGLRSVSLGEYLFHRLFL
jgi:hypothetical protein